LAAELKKGGPQKFVRPEKLAAEFLSRFADKGPNSFEEYPPDNRLKISA
jgi:hypothetical protein